MSTSSSAGVGAWRNNWKDGCPPYANTRDRPFQVFGVSPEQDTMLGTSHVSAEFRRVKFTNSDDQQQFSTTPPLRLRVAQLTTVLNSSHGPSLTLSYAAGTDPDGPWREGNLLAGIGYRYVAGLLGDAARLGFAVRVETGGSPTDSSGNTQPLNRFAVQSPFGTQTFAFDRPVVATFETRAEFVGCHAPFAHLRIDVVEWHAPDAHALPPFDARNKQDRAWAIPMTMSLGGFVRPMVGFAFQLGVELRTPESSLQLGTLVRSRALLDIRVPFADWATSHVVLHADALTGDADGVEVGAALSLDLHDDGTLE